jgi:hypothetical protein
MTMGLQPKSVTGLGGRSGVAMRIPLLAATTDSGAGVAALQTVFAGKGARLSDATSVEEPATTDEQQDHDDDQQRVCVHVGSYICLPSVGRADSPS